MSADRAEHEEEDQNSGTARFEPYALRERATSRRSREAPADREGRDEPTISSSIEPAAHEMQSRQHEDETVLERRTDERGSEARGTSKPSPLPLRRRGRGGGRHAQGPSERVSASSQSALGRATAPRTNERVPTASNRSGVATSALGRRRTGARETTRVLPAVEPEPARALVDDVRRNVADVLAVLVEVASTYARAFRTCFGVESVRR
jgi:hypothetical protein